MCKVPVKLRELVKQRLAAAAEEIFELLERTITEYEEEAERQRRLMETLLQPRVLVPRTTASAHRPPSVRDAESGPEPPHIKEEPNPTLIEEEQSEEVSMKSEETSETWTQPVHHNQTVDCPEPPVPVAASGDHLLHLNNRSVDKKTKKRQRKTRNRVKSHVCQNCGKGCLSKAALINHMRVHTRERPFICSDCGKRFTHKGNMETHKRIHSGLKPYSCTVCGKAFVQKCSLDRHFLVHTLEKPFSCSVCRKQFRFKSNLAQHMFTHR